MNAFINACTAYRWMPVPTTTAAQGNAIAAIGDDLEISNAQKQRPHNSGTWTGSNWIYTMRILILFCAFLLIFASNISDADAAPRVLLDANFNAHIPNQPIGTGGPGLGEPVTLSAPSDFSAIIRAAPRTTNSLELAQLNPGSTRSARFEFLDAEEVSAGDVQVRLIFHATQLDSYVINIREPATNTQAFLSLSLSGTGNIGANDAAGFAGTIGTYTANTDFQLKLIFHMDLGTYDIELDSVPLLTGRSHGLTSRGIGALLVGVGAQAAANSLFYVDNIRITAPDDGVFDDGFE